MEKYEIGTVYLVGSSEIHVRLLPLEELEDNTERGVPDAMVVNLPTESGPSPLPIGHPGSYVEVAVRDRGLLGLIIGVRMTELSLSGIGAQSGSGDLLPVQAPERLLTVVPVGTFSPDGSFERGADVLPTVGSRVFAVSQEKLRAVFRAHAEGDFPIGTISALPEEAAHGNIDTLFARHTALVGQTGSGKSWTVASLIQSCIKHFSNPTILLFDLHGEYEGVFPSEVATYVRASEIELPYWLMNFEELVNLCVDRGEREAPNQVAKFRDAPQTEKERAAQEEGLSLPKVTLDTPIFFDLENVLRDLRGLDREMEPGTSGRERQGPFYGQFTRMLVRMESRLNDRRYDLIFRPQKYTTSASMDTLMRNLLGEEEASPRKVVVLDISPIPFDVRASAISLVLRAVFEHAYWHRRRTGISRAILVACDEAHSYLSERDLGHQPSRLAAERIAKEGRKYGVGLLLVSQRPREVSGTILSQCSTFMCLRLTNPDDQQHVRGFLPDSFSGLVDVFGNLRRGETLVLGDAVMMPMRIRLTAPDPAPKSADVSFRQVWSSEREPLDMEADLDEWRRQGLP